MTGKPLPDEGVQAKIYAAISHIFSKYSSLEKRLVIEILPPGINPPEGETLLEDEIEASVGIPKKFLVVAFLKARSIFTSRGSKSFGDEVH